MKVSRSLLSEVLVSSRCWIVKQVRTVAQRRGGLEGWQRSSKVSKHLPQRGFHLQAPSKQGISRWATNLTFTTPLEHEMRRGRMKSDRGEDDEERRGRRRSMRGEEEQPRSMLSS